MKGWFSVIGDCCVWRLVLQNPTDSLENVINVVLIYAKLSFIFTVWKSIQLNKPDCFWFPFRVYTELFWGLIAGNVGKQNQHIELKKAQNCPQLEAMYFSIIIDMALGKHFNLSIAAFLNPKTFLTWLFPSVLGIP